MSFHMEAFRSSLASGATDVFQQVTFISTGAVLAPAANGMQVSAFLSKIHSLFGVGAHLENIRPQANSFQPAPYPVLAPNNIGTAIESPSRFWDFSAYPKAMRPTEEFDIFASQTSGGAETEAVFVNFTDGIIQPAPPISTQSSLNAVGQFFIAHATAATTLTANAWSQVTPVLDTPLPAGTYALLGVRAMSAHALAFRVKPINEPVWRPGGVGVQTADQYDPVNQRYLNPLTGRPSPWGVWMTFYQNTVPYIEFWASAADTVEDLFFDLVKVSDVVTAPAL
jgi:hypothetical protein